MKNDSVSISVGTSSCSIEPSEGGRIKNLKLNDTLIIDSLPIDYSASYASSILFPFVNRIENGLYKYNGKEYSLDINLGPNAIHGLVYDKAFKIEDKNLDDNFASITLVYNNENLHAGYPYFYMLKLVYSISNFEFKLSLDVKNLSDDTMPFNVGWHPYFYSSDLNHSYLKIDSDRQFRFNEHLIPQGYRAINWKDFKNISMDNYDDCFQMNSDKLEFKTKDYHILLSSNLNQNYLQIYTPEQRNYIAIEPMSSPPNSFNSKIGLFELASGESFSVEWKIKLI